MPAIGWIFLVLAIGMILGSLFMLRDKTPDMPESEEDRKKIRERVAEIEAEESAEDREK